MSKAVWQNVSALRHIRRMKSCVYWRYDAQFGWARCRWDGWSPQYWHPDPVAA